MRHNENSTKVKRKDTMIKKVLPNRFEGMLGHNRGIYNKGSLDL